MTEPARVDFPDQLRPESSTDGLPPVTPAGSSGRETAKGFSVRWVAVFALFAAVFFLLDVPFRDFWSQNEGRYALGAASVLEGRWLVPTIIPGTDADKPPLFFWLVAAISAPFGKVTAWTPRLANLMAAFVALAAVVQFGRITRNRWVGFLSAVILATSYEFWDQMTFPGVDVLMTAMLTVAWVALFLMLVEGFTWRRWTALWVFMGLAFLTKGPVALILSGLVAMVFAFWQFGRRDGWRRLFRLRPFIGTAVACAPFALWAGAVYVVLGIEPLKETVIRHNFARFFEAFDHDRPWYFLIYEMPLCTLPWSALLPFALWHGLRARRARRDPSHLPLYFAASVVLVVVGFFSLSSSKQDYYLLPLIPWFGYAVSVFIWDRFVAAEPSAAGASRWSDLDLLRRFLATGIGKAAVGILSLMVLATAIRSTVVAAMGNERKSPIPLVEAIHKAADENNRLVFIDCDNLIIFFYMEKPYEIVDHTAEHLAQLRRAMEKGATLDIVIEESDLRHLSRFDGIPLYVEGKEDIKRKAYYILTNEAKFGLQRYS